MRNAGADAMLGLPDLTPPLLMHDRDSGKQSSRRTMAGGYPLPASAPIQRTVS